VISDPNGAFEIADVGEGVWRYTVTAEGYRMTGEGRCEVRRGETTRLRVALFPVPPIRGFVADAHGLPAENAAVWPRRVRAENGESQSTHLIDWGLAYTDREGRFVLRVPEAERTYDMVASLGDEGLGFAEGALPGGPEIEIRLRPAGRITGRIRNADGKPVVDEKVSAYGGGPWGAPWESAAQTDGEGVFSIGGLCPGLYMISLWVGDALTQEHRGSFSPVRVREDEEPPHLELMVQRNQLVLWE
jgi:hypothetical protein